MSRREWRRLGRAAQDPAITLLLLLPLGLLHLSGRGAAPNAALGVVDALLLQTLGRAAGWTLAAVLGLLLLWAIGRIRALGLPWRGGAVLALGEGVLCGLLLAPSLRLLTALVPIEWAWLGLLPSPAGDGLRVLHGGLAVAAGAGLYEELVFRAGLLGGLALLLRAFVATLGWREAAPTVAVGLALLVSAGVFAWAHSAGDPRALEAQVFAFRFLAGIVLGALFAWRGLAVVAYAHFTYDAVQILSSSLTFPAPA